jgi:hypothetical protein
MMFLLSKLHSVERGRKVIMHGEWIRKTARPVGSAGNKLVCVISLIHFYIRIHKASYTVGSVGKAAGA